MEWQERRVLPSDVEELTVLEALISASRENSWDARSVTEAVSARGARVRLASRSDGVAIGFVVARRIVDLLEIDLVGVVAEHRRMGVARSLVERLIAEETGVGLTEARLELAESNEPARGLYAGLGFVVVGRRTRYYPDGEDALLLSRPVISARSVPPQ